LLDMVELTPEEAAALVPLFPTLLDWAGVTPADTDDRPLVWPVPYPRQVLTPAMVAARNLLGLFPLVPLAGGMGLAFLAISHDQWFGGFPTAGVIGVTCALGGLLLLFVALTRGWQPGTAFLDWRLRRRWRRRPDALVSPDEPGAVAVEVIPRANWHRPLLEN